MDIKTPHGTKVSPLTENTWQQIHPLPLDAAKSVLLEMQGSLSTLNSSLAKRISAFRKLDAMRVARYAWTLGLTLIVLNFAVIFAPMFVSRASTVPPALQNPATKQFVADLQHIGSNPTVMENIVTRRAELSTQGTTIILGGDSVQAFEYGDAGTAAREGKSFAEKYAAAAKDGLYQPLSLYRENSLLVLYLGNRESILKALDTVLGSPIVGGLPSDQSR